MKKIINSFTFLLIALTVFIELPSCKKDLKNNGLEDASIDADFTITPIAGVSNKYVLKSNNEKFLASKWDIGTGAGSILGKNEETIFLPDAGTYTIVHTAVGKGGTTANTSKTLVVPVSDPVAGNLVLGSKLSTPADHAKWTILNISSSGDIWSFSATGATVSPSSWGQQGIYQAITVVANKQYKMDMVISSPVGIPAGTTWFEVYANATPPVQGQDYTAGGRRMGISTWDGCGLTPFSGFLSSIGCVGSGNTFSFPTSGVIYLVIKSGSGANPNITIKNVELRGV
jgi:hypothetical protein